MKFKRAYLSVGLDIGTSTIKLVKLKFLRNTIELCDFILEPVQANLAETLKNIKEFKGIQTVNIGVSGSSTVLRYVNLPRMNKAELAQALKFEAQEHIPFSTEEINLDSCILKDDLPGNKMLILLAAVKKEIVSQRLKLLEGAGLRANLIDIDSLALVNAFNFNYTQDDNIRHKAVTLLNIGASMSNLNILENGIPYLSRDIHIAGNNFTQKLVDTLGIDFKSAEELKLNPVRNITETTQDSQISNGVNPVPESSGKVAEALESVLTNLSTEIRLSFDYYESQSASSVAKIFLSGGGSKMTGLKDMLANFLGIEVEYWDPLKQIGFSDQVDAQRVKTLFSQLAVAVGMALRV